MDVVAAIISFILTRLLPHANTVHVYSTVLSKTPIHFQVRSSTM